MSKPLRVCLLGAGYIADWHARAIASAKLAKVVAVCDQSAGRAGALAKRWGAECHVSLDAMLAQAAGLDAVHVLLPPQAHEAAAMRILAAGLHVFVEKPLAITAEGCERLVAEAERRQRLLGVGHNFLFVPAYDELVAAIEGGSLGIIDSIRVTWAKDLPQFSYGPHNHWMFASPANVLMEVGPHNCAQVLHAARAASRVNGEKDDLRLTWARCDKPIDLPRGRSFRRWMATAEVGSVLLSMEWSLVPGFTQHRIEVRGSMGNAVADLDRNIFTIEQHTHRATDFDRAAVLRQQARGVLRQARHNLTGYLLEKAKLGKSGNLFGRTIGLAMKCFHEAIASGKLDPRVAGSSGVAAVRLCEDIGAMGLSGAELPAVPRSPSPQPCAGKVDALVLGGGGFIGKALVRCLLRQGRKVRVMGRNASDPGLGESNERVQAMAGDARNPGDLQAAMEGASIVFHLARGDGRTWQEWFDSDVSATRLVAEMCKARGIGRLVYTSTIAALDMSDPHRVIVDDGPTDDPNKIRQLYARSKAVSEQMLLKMHPEGLDVVIARPGIVIGSGCTPYHSGVAEWTGGRVASLWGSGRNPLPFVLVDDCAEALVKCGEAPGVAGRAFNLVGGVSMTANDYIDALEEAIGVRFVRRPVSAWRSYLADLFKWSVKVAVRHPGRRIPRYAEWKSRGHLSSFDTTKGQRLLQWAPRSDRVELIREGIVRPAEEFVLRAAGVRRTSNIT